MSEKTKRRLTKALLETAKDMRRAGILTSDAVRREDAAQV